MKTHWIALVTGLILVVVHEGIYRRTVTAGESDYELGGLITHAGIDILGAVLIISFVLWVAETWRR